MSDDTGISSTVRTEVVRAHLQGLVATHDEADLLRLLVLQETHITGTALLPLL